MARFAPLIPCDVEDCRTLVEPHVARCPDHVRLHGHSPKKRQVAGQALSEPKRPAHRKQ